ncbi:hypothetical protein GF376_04640 [Candidatus Peregrinibacteria bacterium]|nr:hypothetical protein [Candidatus Peregrinibacteria bacterium]
MTIEYNGAEREAKNGVDLHDVILSKSLPKPDPEIVQLAHEAAYKVLARIKK